MRPAPLLFPMLTLLAAACGGGTGDDGECTADAYSVVDQGFARTGELARTPGEILTLRPDEATIETETSDTVVFRWAGAPLTELFAEGDAVTVERRREALDDFPPFEAYANIDVVATDRVQAVALELEELVNAYTYPAGPSIRLGDVRCCAACGGSSTDHPCRSHATSASLGAEEATLARGAEVRFGEWTLTSLGATSVSVSTAEEWACRQEGAREVRIGVAMVGPVE